ncbi:LCP family protein [Bacillus sp. FJAT-45350]|uniref:LCP family protein n=1 Tax=Bacillus sp. FJAT-45350 TaxID=2011014 RepID=UPI000BB87799|nr:LCP family protein [Bacillus sp. FJAT-45350]
MKSRLERKKRQKRYKKKKLFIVLSVFSLFLVVSAAYGAIQYDIGRTESSTKISGESTAEETNEDIEVIPIEFNSDEEKDEYINILLVGIDADEGERARTDTIMIAQYNGKEGTAKLASIMRDSYVTIPGYRDNKINSSFFFGGPELLRKTIKENFDIDLHYYAMVNFDGFVQVVDVLAPNGIEVDIQNRMYYRDSYADMEINFHPGEQTLVGKDALKYVRFRSDNENDFGRVRRQQEVLNILKDELLSISGITRLPRLIGSIEPYVDTNITTGKVLNIGRDFILNPVSEVETLTIPVENGYRDSRYSHAGSVLELDMEKNKQALHEFFNLQEKSSTYVSNEEDEKKNKQKES